MTSRSESKSTGLRVRVLIPYRHHPQRAAALELVLAYWQQAFPDWPLTIATGSDYGWGFNKARALNTAILKVAEPAETLVIADADSLVPPAQVFAAVTWLDAGGRGPVSAFTEYRRLSRADTAALRDWRDAFALTPEWSMAQSGSTGCLAVRLADWLTLDGMDDRFPMPLYEDLAFWTHAAAIFGPVRRVNGPLVHLWHERDEGRWPQLEAECKARYELYQQAAGDPDALVRLRS